MAWIKLDDGFLDHPKFLEVGPLAGYLNICAIAWANRNLTNGLIPRAQVARLVNWDGIAHRMWQGEIVGGGEDADALALADTLVEFGLWETVLGGFQIHDYLEHQRSAAQILEDRAKNAERQARFRNATRRDTTNTKSNAGTNGAVTDAKKLEVEEEAKTPPNPPRGKRQKDRDSFEENLKYFTAEHFPGIAPGYVGDAASRLRARGVEPTVEALRPLVEHFAGLPRAAS